MSNHNMDETKGRIKQAVGDLTDNADLKREGKADRAGASVKKTADNVADKVADGVDKVKDKFTSK